MDILKYNTRVRQAMSDSYVDCSRQINSLEKEMDGIITYLEENDSTIPYTEYLKLLDKKDRIESQIENLRIERNVWDKAREICLDVADEMCDKSEFKSDISYMKGIIWYAGDVIFIETKNHDGLIREKVLVDILKENIKENSKVHIIINAEDN